MCEYQRINEPIGKKRPVPICDYTKERCTFCLYGNSDTYKKAMAAEEEGKDGKE